MTTLFQIEFANRRKIVDRAVIAAKSAQFAGSEAASLMGTMNALYGATSFNISEYSAKPSSSKGGAQASH